MPKTCIIGAGVTGLSTAWQLKKSGEEILVLESHKEVGGAIQSINNTGYLVEEGPNSIQLKSRQIEEFLNSIPGLREQMIDAESDAKNRFIVRNNRPCPVPRGPIELLSTPLWSKLGCLHVLAELFKVKRSDENEESVADFSRRRLGHEFYDYAINPLIGGIYAGNPEELSIRYAFPRLYALENEYGGLIRGMIAKLISRRKESAYKCSKRIISFKDGLSTLPKLIAQALGDSIHLGIKINSIESIKNKWIIKWDNQYEQFDRLIVTVPAHALGKLPFNNDLKNKFSQFCGIDHPPLSVLTVGFKREHIKHPLDGFGLLVPESEKRNILGVLFPSSIFKGRAPKGEVLLTVFFGGERNPDYATENTEKALATAMPEINSILGVIGPPTFVHLKYWKKAIPQYKIGYGRYFEALNLIEEKYTGIHILGNYRNGISLDDCLSSSIKFGTKIYNEII